MAIKTNQWVFLENTKWGRLFAAVSDKKDNDHLVETDPARGSELKHQWMIHFVGGNYYIQNAAYGFMFAAENDKKDNDHLVECSPDVTTLSAAMAKGSAGSKWVWTINEVGSTCSITNGRYGKMFAADSDKKDNDHLVEARPGSAESGDKWTWTIKEVWSTSHWMADSASAIANIKLTDLVIPGTHDSGSYACSSTSTIAPKQDIPEWVNAVYAMPLVGLGVMEIIARWSKAQGSTIAEQLTAGIRYLDLRVVRSGTSYYTCHSLYGASMDAVIEQTRAFIAANPKEIIILDLSHLYDMASVEQNTPLIDKLIAAFGAKMAPRSMGVTSTVQDFWNSGYQIIALYDNADCVARYPTLWSQDSISSPWPNTTSLTTLKTDLDSNLANRATNKFFVLQGVLTPDGSMIAKGLVPFTSDPSSLENLAKTVTPAVTGWLREWSNRKLNIAIVDWFNCADYVATIRDINMAKR